jgi:GTPase SAR1 family protein
VFNVSSINGSYVDYSAAKEDEAQLERDMQKADVICVVYAVNDPASKESIQTRWLPKIRRLGRNVLLFLAHFSLLTPHSFARLLSHLIFLEITHSFVCSVLFYFMFISQIPVVLVGNKFDLAPQERTLDDLRRELEPITNQYRVLHTSTLHS